eukprot:TRINITY_DN27070_c0_g1_i2.p1 TRINITY_DN27070_c0_g1~~TRINITY_DN27070_c0_g1_i2.p1  ORF type:complete len:812 (-),score=140.16 TRINITY_DN27070_c0_g1_i2:87-2522(-)
MAVLRALLLQVVLACMAAGQDTTFFGFLPGEDTEKLGLNYVLGPNIQTQFCSRQEKTDTVDKVFTTCKTFCGKGNMALLLGLPAVGINQSDMDSICLGAHGMDNLFGRYDPGSLDTCKQGRMALERIQLRVAELVAEQNLLVDEQTRFRTQMRLKTSELVAELSKDSTTQALMFYSRSERPKAYLELVEAYMNDTLKTGSHKAKLITQLTELSKAAEQLHIALKRDIPFLEAYTEKCGEPILMVGTGDQYLMDICNQQTRLAISEEEGQHVGCCCGMAPAAIADGTPWYIPADTTGRRLQTSTIYDACAEAGKLAKTRSDELHADMQETAIGKQTLQEQQAALQKTYPEYFSRCDQTRRLDSNDGELTVTEVTAERKLADVLTCSPPVFSAQQSPDADSPDVLKVAFWKHTETAYCNAVPGMPNASEGQSQGAAQAQYLSSICADFCGSEAVPLLLGNAEIGFDQEAMESMCIDSTLLESNEAKVDACHEKARAMQSVEIKVAALISAVNVLNARKVQYEGAVRLAVNEMKKQIEERGEKVLMDARWNEKAQKYNELLKSAAAEAAKTSASSLAFKQALTNMKKSADELTATLATALPAYQEFLTGDCGNVFLGKGRQDEYLLDLCSQNSIACIEEQRSAHAGCCCAYTPHMAVGKKSLESATIPGISKGALLDSEAFVAARRLAEASAPFDVCGEAYNGAYTSILAAQKDIQNLQASDLLDSRIDALRSTYPDYDFCWLSAPSTSPPPDTTPSPPPPTPTPPSPTPTPPSPTPSAPSPSPSPSQSENSAVLTHGLTGVAFLLAVLLFQLL